MSNTALILTTARYAAIWHRKQKRAGKSKDRMPYVIHPLEVASLIAEAEGDPETICAGLLHDVKEDCGITDEQILAIYSDQTFGRKVAEIVEEVTDFKELTHDQNEARQVRLMISGYSPQAKVVKLADKTSNMRSMTVHPPQWSLDGHEEVAYIFQMRRMVEAGKGVNSFLESLFWEAYTNATHFYNMVA